MTLTKLEGELFIRLFELLRQQCLQLEGNLEETSSLVNKLDAKWADVVGEEMGKLRENVSIIEEKARKKWISLIKQKCEQK